MAPPDPTLGPWDSSSPAGGGVTGRFNLLATSYGRLVAFFLLYVGEGLPQGFTATAVALEFKRMGMEAEAMGSFLAIILAPWAWKWMFGPIIDNLHLPRFGRRSQWVVAMQIGMLLSLAGALWSFPTVMGPDEVPVGMGLFTGLLILNSLFSAAQDVAIDAMAVSVLSEEERGKANGLMFAGAQVGATVGGSGVVFLKGVVGFSLASLLVPACLFGLLVMVTLFVAEKGIGAPPPVRRGGVDGALRDIGTYFVTVLRVFFTTRKGAVALLLALLPFGGLAFSLTLSTIITPTLGMTDDEIASLGFAASVLFVVTCITGGWLSDRLGRRLTLGIFAGATVLPTLWMAWQLQSAGFLVPPDAPPDGIWPRQEALIVAWVGAQLVYTVFQGMMYGVSTALFMDLCEPAIAATQFTACMAVMNLVTMYSYWWEGQALTSVADGGWGFTLPGVLVADSMLGLVFLLVLPLVSGAVSKQVTADPVPVAR